MTTNEALIILGIGFFVFFISYGIIQIRYKVHEKKKKKIVQYSAPGFIKKEGQFYEEVPVTHDHCGDIYFCKNYQGSKFSGMISFSKKDESFYCFTPTICTKISTVLIPKEN